jgi:hypothetical protein
MALGFSFYKKVTGMELDIRKQQTQVDVIRFADNNAGLGKGCILTDGSGPQVNISRGQGLDYQCHIKYDDIDSFILALQEAKRLWQSQ